MWPDSRSEFLDFVDLGLIWSREVLGRVIASFWGVVDGALNY